MRQSWGLRAQDGNERLMAMVNTKVQFAASNSGKRRVHNLAFMLSLLSGKA